MKNYQKLAKRFNAIQNCIESENREWLDKHAEAIEDIMTTAPSGSGIDTGIAIDLEKSTEDRIILSTAYHHMNESGMYNGWTEHNVYITPSLAFEFNLRITGTDRNEIKEYLHQVIYDWLTEEVNS